MPLVATDAIVLHVFDYLETSRILRLITRELGIVSVLAKGARRSRARYGSALDLFAEGEAQLNVRPSRELQNVQSFDVTISRNAVSENFERFMAASAIAELVLHIGRDDANAGLYQIVSDTLRLIATVQTDEIISATLSGAWQIVSSSGFTPALDVCAYCHADMPNDVVVSFAHAPGGVLCSNCVRLAPVRRKLPPDARNAIRAWLNGEAEIVSESAAKAHQRLFREFLQEHVASQRPLRAFSVWEGGFANGTDPSR